MILAKNILLIIAEIKVERISPFWRTKLLHGTGFGSFHILPNQGGGGGCLELLILDYGGG